MLINNIRKSPTCPIRNTIHAPTRGATSAVAWKWKLHIISIHAPTRGATPYGLLTANVRLFQSTLLQEERRLLLQICIKNRRFQSTLLQEERPISTSLLKRAINFNPRSYKRSDSKNAQYSLCISAIIIA